MYIVHFTMYNLQCTMYNVHFTTHPSAERDILHHKTPKQRQYEQSITISYIHQNQLLLHLFRFSILDLLLSLASHGDHPTEGLHHRRAVASTHPSLFQISVV